MFSEQTMLCYSRGWVKQYVESKNSEGKQIKIVFSAYFWNILPPNMVVPPVHDTCDVMYIRDFRAGFGGKICNVWRRQDGAGYFVSYQRAFLFTNTRLFYVIATG
jgi:hypothetical protein